MYLSRLILNPRSRRVQRDTADPYQMHRRIMKAFPPELRPGDERVLFRLEPDARDGRLLLLVQSLTLPDWSCLREPGAPGYLLPVSEPNPAVKSFALELAAGQILAFRLYANPTVKRRFPSGDHKRVALFREEEQIAWLERKGAQGGFRPVTVRTSRRDMLTGRMRRNGELHKLGLLAVQFDGLLQVSDPDRLRQAVRSGVGSGKGFGCGLLSLAPPSAGA
jgi:CRISPR system Cascade subunit CasE